MLLFQLMIKKTWQLWKIIDSILLLIPKGSCFRRAREIHCRHLAAAVTKFLPLSPDGERFEGEVYLRVIYKCLLRRSEAVPDYVAISVSRYGFLWFVLFHSTWITSANILKTARKHWTFLIDYIWSLHLRFTSTNEVIFLHSHINSGGPGSPQKSCATIVIRSCHGPCRCHRTYTPMVTNESYATHAQTAQR